MNLAIFGAQAIALGTYKALKKQYPEKNILCFLVSKLGMNASVLSGLAVREVDLFAAGLSPYEKENTEVLIATPEPVMPEIEQLLDSQGLCRHKRVTSGCFEELMEAYFADNKKYIPLSTLQVGNHKPDMQVFMAKFYKDKQLTGTYVIPEWMTPIQVGASLCEERVAHILDCDGDNISKKNVNYCELTALYWMWKNRLECDSDFSGCYYGLAHYRRMLNLTEEDVYRLEENDVDVVLPYPMPYEPNIEAHHERYLKAVDWKALLTALEELQPEYAEKFPQVLGQQYLYNYNIVLARKEVLRDYCRWLFPILERVEELSEPKGWERQDRYIGYMGETLSTLYFMANRDRLNIAHAGCRFLV
ncbi:MAG: DUF4422 domain-containing protein [Alphaproteobacteria bacterium]|nr:DUF4422 domain-containing protein [Alphaproteobacteria bacterium]MBQ6888562.1 DUF4422 domain-containing protein [Lachnospiraceae bacterium]